MPVIQVDAERVLRGDRGRLVHGAAAHRTVDGRHLGAGGDLHDPAVVADLLRDLRADLRGDAAGRLRRLHAGLHGTVVAPSAPSSTAPATPTRRGSASVWYPPPYTYGVAAAPVYNPYVGYTFGFAMGLATAAWMEPYWGGAYYHPPTGAAIRAAARPAPMSTATGATPRIRARAAGMRAAASPARRPAAATRPPPGTTGNINAGPPIQRLDGQRHARLRPHREHGRRRLGQRRARQQLQRLHRPALDGVQRVGHRAGGSSYQRTGATTAGPEGSAHAGEGSTYNAKTGNTNTWATASVGNNHYADVNGNVYHNDGSGWQQHSSSGWSGASGDSSWADRESQARSGGADRGAASPVGTLFGGGGGFGGGGFGGGELGGGGGGGGGFGGARRIPPLTQGTQSC